MAAEQLVRISASELPIGKRVRNPIFLHTGQTVLLPAGGKITPDFLENLKKREIKVVRVHAGDRDAWAAPTEVQGVQRIEFGRLKPAPLPDAVRQFVQELAGAKRRSAFDEKRAQPRYPLVGLVQAVPVDDSCIPIGPAFQGMSRNISTGGICFVCTRAVRDKRFVIELATSPSERVQMVMEMVRCQRLGRFYEVGGRLLARLEPV